MTFGLSLDRQLVLITCIAFVVDYMLYMAVIPVIPIYFRVHGIYKPANWTDPDTGTVHRVYPGEHTWNGYLFSSKAFVHILTCPFCGTLGDRIGYQGPLMFGLLVISASTTLFALASGYWVLFVARSLQGLGSAFAETCALAMVVRYFSDFESRTRNVGLAFGSMQFGYLFGPLFGGVLYQYTNKFWPFFFMALLALFDAYLVWAFMRESGGDMRSKEMATVSEDQVSIWRLFKDPRVAVCSGALAISEVAYTFMAPNVAVWMQDTIDATETEIGATWFAAFFPYLIGIRTSVWFLQHHPDKAYIFTCTGLLLAGAACLAIPFTAWNYFMISLWFGVISFGIALIHHCINVLLAEIVDENYEGAYGSVYAIAEISYNFTYSLGPITAGHIVRWFNFYVLSFVIAAIYGVYAPAMLTLRKAGDKDRGNATKIVDETKEPVEDTSLQKKTQGYGATD